MSTTSKEGDKHDDLLREFRQLSERVGRIERHLALAVTVAIVFGVGGAWGFTIIKSVKDEIGGLDKQFQDVKEQADQINGTFASLSARIPEIEDDIKALQLNTILIDKERALAVAKMREEAAMEVVRLQDKYREAGDHIRKDQDAARIEIDNRTNAALASLGEEGKSAEAQLLTVRGGAEAQLRTVQGDLQEQTSRLFSSAKPGWKNCAWVSLQKKMVNYPDSTVTNSTWCPNGKFITQLDLGHYTIDRVLCCFPGLEL